MKMLHTLSRFVTALLLLLVFAACQWMTEDYDDTETYNSIGNGSKRFINFSISVSNGVMPTRADEKPAGGENGDGREAGFNRENEVKGVTLFFFEGSGINADATTPIKLVAYYPLTAITTVKRDDAPTGEANLDDTTRPGITPDEYVFTTGNQLLDKSISPSTAYHVIAVLNANLTGETTLTTLGAVRDFTFSTLYNRSNGGNDPEQCDNFIMSSEQDFTMQLDNADDWTKTSTSEADYYVGNKPLRVERLAARIDFWAAGSNGYKNSTDNAAYTIPGYEYTVTNKSTGAATDDRFVVTGVTPFNLNAANTTNGGEFLVKRLAASLAEDAAISYLADENTSNYVLDPATKIKTDGSLTYFQNMLGSFVPAGDDKTLADVLTLSNNSYYMSVADRHAAVNATNQSAGFTRLEDGISGEDFIVCYPMENTLWSSSKLYYYATGLAVEGDFYENGTFKDHRIYFGYMRHQGTAASYNAMLGSDVNVDATFPGTTAMEYSIVRNNIYRVYISKVTKDELTNQIKVTLLIKVKKWDKFVHTPIIM